MATCLSMKREKILKALEKPNRPELWQVWKASYLLELYDNVEKSNFNLDVNLSEVQRGYSSPIPPVEYNVSKVICFSKIRSRFQPDLLETSNPRRAHYNPERRNEEEVLSIKITKKKMISATFICKCGSYPCFKIPSYGRFTKGERFFYNFWQEGVYCILKESKTPNNLNFFDKILKISQIGVGLYGSSLKNMFNIDNFLHINLLPYLKLKC